MGRLRVAAAKTMRRYGTGSDRQCNGLRLRLPLSQRGALGPRTTGKPRTTAASHGMPIAQVSSGFRAFAQVMQEPGLSLARRKSPETGNHAL
jgi:hypothetical protein